MRLARLPPKTPGAAERYRTPSGPMSVYVVTISPP
jgi:hypothetical protein